MPKSARCESSPGKRDAPVRLPVRQLRGHRQRWLQRALERLLPQLRRAEPRAWRAVYALYEQSSFRRRAWCPRCGAVAAPDHIGLVHRHGRRTVALQPRMVRVPLYVVDDADVGQGVGWLEAHWRGEVLVPEERRDEAAVA